MTLLRLYEFNNDKRTISKQIKNSHLKMNANITSKFSQLD